MKEKSFRDLQGRSSFFLYGWKRAKPQRNPKMSGNEENKERGTEF